MNYPRHIGSFAAQRSYSRLHPRDSRLIRCARKNDYLWLSPGFSLLESLIVLLLISMLFVIAAPLTTDWYQQRYAMIIIADIKQALHQAEIEAMTSGKTVRLVPCTGCSRWSQGIALISEQTSDIFYEWRWPKSSYTVSWHGFIADHYLRFSPDLRHAALNGYFMIHNPHQHGWKLMVNRLGYSRMVPI